MAAVATGQDAPTGRESDLGVALDTVGARWTLLIVDALLRLGPCRFRDLTDALDGISTNLLSERLRELEDSGVIRREVTDPPGSVVSYTTTALGHALSPAIESLAGWGRRVRRRSPARL